MISHLWDCTFHKLISIFSKNNQSNDWWSTNMKICLINSNIVSWKKTNFLLTQLFAIYLERAVQAYQNKTTVFMDLKFQFILFSQNFRSHYKMFLFLFICSKSFSRIQKSFVQRDVHCIKSCNNSFILERLISSSRLLLFEKYLDTKLREK